MTHLASDAFQTLADACRKCYQCGQCSSACPSGWDLTHGPRFVMRLLLANEREKAFACEDLWRCSECGACTRACPMEIDVAGTLATLRALELAHGAQRGPERMGNRMAIKHLAKRKSIDNLSFGMAMVSRGFVPKDVWRSAGTAATTLLARLKRPKPSALPHARAFFPGCALRQDEHCHRLILQMASDLGMPLSEASEAICCGHPTRGEHPQDCLDEQPVLTACPGCASSLADAGASPIPIWESLVEQARQTRRALVARAAGFVPYVGCLENRDHTLATLQEAARLAGIRAHIDFPSLHAGCCGALGGVFRGPTQAARNLIAYASQQGVPIVTTCLLCRDNLRSAARTQNQAVPIYFWPEFFQASHSLGMNPNHPGGPQ